MIVIILVTRSLENNLNYSFIYGTRSHKRTRKGTYMKQVNQNDNITIDGVDYVISDLSNAAILHIENIRFVDEKLFQLQNELSISNTARAGYLRRLNAKRVESTKSHG